MKVVSFYQPDEYTQYVRCDDGNVYERNLLMTDQWGAWKKITDSGELISHEFASNEIIEGNDSAAWWPNTAWFDQSTDERTSTRAEECDRMVQGLPGHTLSSSLST
jgi:hypothetical protein